MAIPTMAIGCSMSNSNSGPGIIESIKEVTDAIESLVMSPPKMPTHLGVGMRFGLSHIGDNQESSNTSHKETVAGSVASIKQLLQAARTH